MIWVGVLYIIFLLLIFFSFRLRAVGQNMKVGWRWIFVGRSLEVYGQDSLTGSLCMWWTDDRSAWGFTPRGCDMD